jgi:hypothetical protein
VRDQKRITRRQFLVLGGGTTLCAFLGGAYLKSGCPLSNSGVCVGPCSAYIDLNHDRICDRIQRSRAAVRDGKVAETADTHPASCPFGLVNDPYPGQCTYYTDADGDGFCDLSLPSAEAAQAAAPTSVHVPDGAVTCPLGLVNDPYPGQCQHYVDRNRNGVCDLSEVEQGEGVIAQETGDPQPEATPVPEIASVACPFGLVNDPYPGACKRYVDTNGDGFCDLSQPGSGTNASSESQEQAEESRQRRRGHGRGGS